MLPEVWQKEIINIHTAVDWVEETSRQLIRDFTMVGIALDFKTFTEDRYRDLFDQARSVIIGLYEKDHHQFLNLLYRIDLPESELRQLLQSFRPPELYDRITEFILRREFLKVVIRHRYSH